MCVRFTMTRRDSAEVGAMLGVPESELGDYAPRYNVAPTQPCFVLATKYESRKVIAATWQSRHGHGRMRVALRLGGWAQGLRRSRGSVNRAQLANKSARAAIAAVRS